jgi:hypothetical protein
MFEAKLAGSFSGKEETLWVEQRWRHWDCRA